MVKLKFTKKALGALALTVLMLFSNINNNVMAQGTLYVNSNWNSDSELPTGLTWGENAFNTIQNAVNAADVSEGAVTISVAEGTYNENVTLNGKSNLIYDNNTKIGRLHFIAEEGKTVTVNGKFTFGNDAVQQQDICDMQFTGLNFTGNNQYPIYIMNSGTASNDIVITNNTVTYSTPTLTSGALYVNSKVVNGLTVTGNKVIGNSNYSASFGAAGGTINNATISGNTFGSFIGVFGQVLTDGVEVSGNTFTGVAEDDENLWINNLKAKSTGKITVSGNTFSSTYKYVLGFKTIYDTKADITIGEGNTYGGNSITAWAETQNDKFLVSSNAAKGEGQYYDHLLYLGDETAFKTAKAAYNAASANGILVMMDSNPVVEIAKSSITANKLGVNTEWAGSAQGTLFNVGDETYCWGINAYSTVAAATAAVQTGQTVKLFSNIEETSVTTIPGGTFLNTNTNDLSATDITMGSKFTVNVTGLDENTEYWVMYYNAEGNWANNDNLKPTAGRTTYTRTFNNVNYASSRTYNASTWDLSGTTTYATTFATIEVDEESTVTFTGFVKPDKDKYVASSNTGVITVDMTDATENSYKLMDYTGSNDAKYGIKGSGYKFAEGKDNGYTLQVIDNDLVAYKSEASKAAVAIKSDWAGTAFGTEVTLNDATYTYGISGFSNFTDALGATDATTTSVVINGETFGKTGNTGTLYLTNTSGGVMNVSTVGAAVSSYPEDCDGTYLSVGSGSEKQNYKFTEGSDLTVFQFYTGGSSNIDITVDGALKTEGSILLNGANVTVSKNGSLSIDGSHRPSASGTLFRNSGLLTVKGDLNLNINDVPNTPEPLRIKIGGDGADNDGIALIVDGGTATLHGVENTTGVEKFSKNPATTVIGGKVDDEGTPATLSVTNSGLYDTDGTIINNGVIKIDVKKDNNNRYSMVKTKDITNTGTITIDVTGATEASYKVIDYTGEGTKELADYGTVTFTGGTATYYAEVKDNDLYATKALYLVCKESERTKNGDTYTYTDTDGNTVTTSHWYSSVSDAISNAGTENDYELYVGGEGVASEDLINPSQNLVVNSETNNNLKKITVDKNAIIFVGSSNATNIVDISRFHGKGMIAPYGMVEINKEAIAADFTGTIGTVSTVTSASSFVSSIEGASAGNLSNNGATVYSFGKNLTIGNGKTLESGEVLNVNMDGTGFVQTGENQAAGGLTIENGSVIGTQGSTAMNVNITNIKAYSSPSTALATLNGDMTGDVTINLKDCGIVRTATFVAGSGDHTYNTNITAVVENSQFYQTTDGAYRTKGYLTASMWNAGTGTLTQNGNIDYTVKNLAYANNAITTIYGLYTTGSGKSEVIGNVGMKFVDNASAGVSLYGVNNAGTGADKAVLTGNLSVEVTNSTMESFYGANRGKINGNFTVIATNSTANTYSVLNGSVASITGTSSITFNGTDYVNSSVNGFNNVTISADATLNAKYDLAANFSTSWTNNGNLNIDMTGATAMQYIIVDNLGSTEMTLASYGTVTLSGDAYSLQVIDNDLYAVNNSAVASITAGGNTVFYATLADAIAEATATDVITMLASTSENVTIPVGKTVTLDLNGKKLSSTGTIITNNGNLTLTDGIGGGNITDGTIGVKQNGTLTLSGKVNITGNGTGDNRCNLYLPSSDKTFSISNPVDGMKVGISKDGDPSQGDIVLSENTSDYSEYFFSDNPNYSVKYDNNKLVLTNGVKVTLTATEGGEVELYVNGEYVGTSAYVTLNNTVTIKATASDSNAFKGWYDTKNPTTMMSGKFTDTYKVTESVVLEARFTDSVIWVRVKKGN